MSGERITEKWQYLTDVIPSYDGHEQRLQLRQYPRRFLSYDYPAMNYMEAQWLRGIGRMRQSDAYFIPMWHTPVYLKESHIAGKALYIQPECMYGLNECEWIEIFVKDDVNQGGVNSVWRVHEYLDGIIALKKSIDTPLNMKNTWIYPLKKCSVQPMENLNFVFSNGSNVTHNFEDLLMRPATVHVPDKYLTEYDDYKQRNRWGLPEVIGDKEVLTISPQWVEDGSVALSVDKGVNRLDNESGSFVYDLKNNKSYDIRTLELSLMNRKAISNMIRFFKRVKGRFKSFYAPTWVNDVEICDDLMPQNNFVYVDWNRISDYYLSNKRRRGLVIFTKDWRSYILEILSYGYELRADGTRLGKITLTAPIGFRLSKDNILMTSFISLVRFDSDELQLNYETSEVANVTLVLREVDDI